MIGALLGVLLFFGASASALRRLDNASAVCSACNDSLCTIVDNVRVRKLCADELCVNGARVAPDDGNPCTSDALLPNGVPVHVPIRDCCATQADCAQWAPDSCHLSTCVPTPAGSQFGVCAHEPIAGCCSCDADCPARTCQTAACVPRDTSQPLFTKNHPNDAHFELIHAVNQIVNAPGECRYTSLPADANCCARSADCLPAQGERCICDADNTCQCFQAEPVAECRTTADCHNNTAATAACRNCGQRCADNVCVRGFCECKVNLHVDFDLDGVTCERDCNDTNAAVNQTIFCTVRNASEANADGDRFVKCGERVEELCALTCPNGRVRVNESQLDESFIHHKNKERFVRFDCDCCDANANNTRPDEFIYCGKDANRNGVFAPVTDEELPPGSDLEEIDLTPPGCFDKVCVIQPESSTKNRRPDRKEREDDEDDDKHGDEDEDDGPRRRFGKRSIGFGGDRKDGRHREEDEDDEEQLGDDGVSNAVRDAQCAANFGSTDFVFVRPEKRNENAQCDQCEDVPGADPDVTRADVDCPATAEIDGETVAACPIESREEGTSLRECCEHLLEIPDNVDNLPDPVRRWKRCCAALDKRGDGFERDPEGDECEDVPNSSFPLNVNTCGCQRNPVACARTAHCVPDNDGDGFFNCREQQTVCVNELPKGCDPQWSEEKIEDAICRDKSRNLGGLLKALNGQKNDPEKFGQNTFCDCNDENPKAHEKIVCFKDSDGDGYPFCNKQDEPKCEDFCADECPKGWLEDDHRVRREKEEWGGGKGGDDNKGWGKDDDDKKPKGPPNCKKRYQKLDATLNALQSTLEKRGVKQDDDKDNDGWRKKEPRRDETCKDYECELCDCCDIDKYAYEGSVWGSADPTKCGNFDYDCDGVDEIVIACPKAKQLDARGDSRIIVEVLEEVGGNDPATGIFLTGLNDKTDDDPIGQCNELTVANPNPETDDCEHTPGWGLEKLSKNRKRGARNDDEDEDDEFTKKVDHDDGNERITFTVMRACEKLVEFVHTQQGGVQVIEEIGGGGGGHGGGDKKGPKKFRDPEFGDCGDFVEQCVEPVGESNVCSTDCEICTRIGQ